jgi:hypothetical protein
MRSRTVRALVVAMGAVFVVLFVAPAAFAHPLGNFTVNRGSAIRLTVGAAEVDYTIDMAEIPTYQELPAIDADGDGVASAQELDAWAQREARVILPGLELRVDGRPVDLSSTSATAALLPGQAGLQTLRFEGTFTGRVTTGSGSIAYQDGNADDGRIGWREVTASGDGVALEGSNVPATSPSDDLRAYPQDMLSSPLDVTSMNATFSSSATAGASAGNGPGASVDAVARPATEAGRLRRRPRPPRAPARAARARPRVRVRRLACPAPRPRQDTDGWRDGGFRRATASGARGRDGGRIDAFGGGDRARPGGRGAPADLPSRGALSVAGQRCPASQRWRSAGTSCGPDRATGVTVAAMPTDMTTPMRTTIVSSSCNPTVDCRGEGS